MPLKSGKSRKTISYNIREFHKGPTYAHTERKFGKERANKQAIAVALSEAGKSNRAQGGAIGVALENMGPGKGVVPNPSPSLPNLASGGIAGPRSLSKIERTIIKGPIVSTVPGRTDHHAAKVPSGSYVVPADIVSGHGQGNTLAGMTTLQKLFKMGPYGSKVGTISHKSGPKPLAKFPKPPKLKSVKEVHIKKVKFAEGGTTHDEPKLVPVNLAGGELVIPPENLMEVVHPDLSTAHEIMDKWILDARKKLRKTLSKLPGPARD